MLLVRAVLDFSTVYETYAQHPRLLMMTLQNRGRFLLAISTHITIPSVLEPKSTHVVGAYALRDSAPPKTPLWLPH